MQENKKILLVLVGDKAVINSFKEKNSELFDEEHTIFLQSDKDLETQLEFIFEEDEFISKTNIILEIYNPSKEKIANIKNQTIKFEELYIKFMFLVTEDASVNDIKSTYGIKGKKKKKGKVSTKQLEGIFSNNNLLISNLDANNYLVEVLREYLGIAPKENLEDHLPDELKKILMGSFILIADKLQQDLEKL